MKLYAWQPKGSGQQSFFVMADSEDSARSAVEMKINELIAKFNDDDYFGDDSHYSEDSFSGFGTEYYSLTVCEQNEVIMNYND